MKLGQLIDLSGLKEDVKAREARERFKALKAKEDAKRLRQEAALNRLRASGKTIVYRNCV